MKIYISKKYDTNNQHVMSNIIFSKTDEDAKSISPISIQSDNIEMLFIEDYTEEILKDILSHIESNYEFYEMADMKSYIKSKIKELNNN